MNRLLPKKASSIYSEKVFDFLVVEDSIFNQLLLRELLLKRFPNAIIDVADNGLEGVNKVEAKIYDLVFMDIKMPVMDGFRSHQTYKSLNNEGKEQNNYSCSNCQHRFF